MAAIFSYGKFEWDERKNIANKKKHNISFEAAVQIFEDIVFEEASKGNHGEKRMLAIGVLENKEIVVISTDRQKQKRIISASRARENERKAYRKFVEENND